MTSTHYITKEGLKKLKEELEDYEKNQRPKVALRLQRAKEFGDLSENAEYSDAKDQQAFIERKISELKMLIRNAVIIQNSDKDGVVRIGSTIIVKFENQEEKEFIIVGSREANPLEGRISNESPMGKAFIGRRVGENAVINAPRGKIHCTIIDIK